MRTERFLMVSFFYMYLGGAHRPLKDMLHLATYFWNSPSIAPGQCILSFESAFLAVTAYYTAMLNY